MYTDPILIEKCRVQNELSQKADFDINKLIENAHKNVIEIAKSTNVNLNYSDRKGGYLSSKK